MYVLDDLVRYYKLVLCRDSGGSYLYTVIQCRTSTSALQSENWVINTEKQKACTVDKTTIHPLFHAIAHQYIKTFMTFSAFRLFLLLILLPTL